MFRVQSLSSWVATHGLWVGRDSEWAASTGVWAGYLHVCGRDPSCVGGLWCVRTSGAEREGLGGEGCEGWGGWAGRVVRGGEGCEGRAGREGLAGSWCSQ